MRSEEWRSGRSIYVILGIISIRFRLVNIVLVQVYQYALPSLLVLNEVSGWIILKHQAAGVGVADFYKTAFGYSVLLKRFISHLFCAIMPVC